MTMTQPRLEELARRWRGQAALRDVLFALTATFGLVALVLIWPRLTWWVPAAGFCAVLLALLARSRPWTLNAAVLARHLDRVHPSLEESSSLWLRAGENLTLLERLQLKRLHTAAVELMPSDAPLAFAMPQRRDLHVASAALIASIVIVTVAATVVARREASPAGASSTVKRGVQTAAAIAPPTASAWPKIIGSELFIVPPAYTGRAARHIAGFNAEVEEGAAVTWKLVLDRPIREAKLVFGELPADTLPLKSGPDSGERFEGSRTITDAGLYHLAATLMDGTAWTPPELFSLRMLRDRPPTVRIVQPALPRTVLDSPAASCTVECLAADDYGLIDAHLVATVAKGEGEAVKFREQTIAFDGDAAATPGPEVPPGARRLTKTLNLAALGLEAGDELYFFVEARDNRQPTANRTRSETRFITIKGPNETPAAGGLGVAGVNLVPPFFRSERQLIIDTEKLIADQPTLPTDEFRRRANDLGMDQQLLRLRYGQFVGEEFEQSAVTDHAEIQLNPLQATPVQRVGPHAAASVAQRFLQEHAEQDREGVDPENETGPRAAAGHPLAAAQVRAPFVDQHDSQDKATFFDHETKGTLRDALDDMWKAEGFLRTARPPEALAPEHQALDILKDLQQSARSYVQHVGFESPPLQIAARRLQGDAAGVPARADLPPEASPDAAAKSLDDVRVALQSVSWEQTSARLTAAEIEALRRVEPALTAAATAHPETYLEGLRAFRRLLAGGEARPEEDLASVEQALFRLLPAAEPLPGRVPEASPALARSYFQALSK